MPTTIKLKNSVITTVIPSSLVQGEVAINVTDKKVFVGNASNTPVQIVGAGSGGGGAAGSNTQVQFNASGALAGSANMVFDGTTITSAFSGPLNGTVGATTANTGAFTTLGASSTATLNTLVSSGATLTGGSINNMAVGASTASTGRFSTLEATGVSTFSAGTVSAPAITTTGDTNTGIFFPAADTIAFSEGGVEGMRIDSAGNVGINTTVPSDRVTVTGGLRSNGATGNANILGALLDWNSATRLFAYDSAGAPMLFFTTPSGGGVTERMRITSTGAVLFGTTVTDPTFNRSNGVNISAGSILSRSAAGFDIGLSVTSGNNINFYTDNGSSRVNAGFISSNGGTSTYATSSDYRMKEDVQPITNALNAVMQLKPVNYKWKLEFAGTKINGQGFIAHELQAVVPDCVTGEKDAVDKDGKPVHQGIDTSFLVATLTAAIQEQQALIQNLTTRLNALEGK